MLGGAPLLARATLDAIYAHAREGHPDEVCGLVFAARAETGYPAAEVHRCENRQDALHVADPGAFPATARTAYDLGARDVMLLDRSLRSERPARIIYHSHVDAGAHLSDEDVRVAAPGGRLAFPVDQLVVDVAAHGVRGARLYRWTSGRFVELARFDMLSSQS